MKIYSTKYEHTPDGVILHTGSAIADQRGERVLALGPNTTAYAQWNGAEAVAIGRDTRAKALGFGARAISAHEGASAIASHVGAVAIRVEGTAYAYAGAEVLQAENL
jgi:hypothetical protein